MGEPVAGLHIRTHPSPVPLAGKSRAPILQSDGVAHAYNCSGGNSMVVAARRQKQERLWGFWTKAQPSS